jgi:hypothetical protein
MTGTRTRPSRRPAHSVEANARLTGSTGAVLLLLFAAEVATVVLGVRSVLTLHVMLGLVLVPPLLVKICSVSWRFFLYYRHDEAYRRKGPPAPALRVLGPVLLATTLVLFVSGITLLLAPTAFGGTMKQIHGITFYLWLLLVLAHVIVHARDLRHLAAKDWLHRTRTMVPGARVRQLVVLATLAAGLALALSLVAHVGAYQHLLIKYLQAQQLLSERPQPGYRLNMPVQPAGPMRLHKPAGRTGLHGVAGCLVSRPGSQPGGRHPAPGWAEVSRCRRG